MISYWTVIINPQSSIIIDTWSSYEKICHGFISNCEAWDKSFCHNIIYLSVKLTKVLMDSKIQNNLLIHQIDILMWAMIDEEPRDFISAFIGKLWSYSLHIRCFLTVSKYYVVWRVRQIPNLSIITNDEIRFTGHMDYLIMRI